MCDKTKNANKTTMACGGDQVSLLAEKLETVSTSECELYKEAKVSGKGVGCIATKAIKKGDLVLKEAPQLFFPNVSVTTFEECLVVVKTFMEMSKEDQERYLDLHNKYDDDETTWSVGMKQRFTAILQATNQMTFPNISQEKAFRVVAIMDTNEFQNGVCLKMSRFNHSCRPNAQYFWNVDTNTRDVRALRKIKQGEEITLSYIHTMIGSREERRTKLKDGFNFDCSCEACDLTEAEIQREIESIDEYKEEKQKKEELQDQINLASDGKIAQAIMKLELTSLKNMYRMAKEIKTMSRRNLLQDVVEEAFDVSAQGAASAEHSRNMKVEKAAWLKDAKMFADIGLEFAKTLNGEDHSMTREWKARSDDPIKFFLKENNGAVLQ